MNDLIPIHFDNIIDFIAVPNDIISKNNAISVLEILIKSINDN